MFGLNALGNAVRTLTGNVLALASTVAEVNQGIRGRLALDAEGEPLPPALESRAAPPPPLPGPQPEGEPEAAANGKPRRKAKAAD